MNLIPLDDVEVEAEDAEASTEGFTLTPIEEEAEFTLTPIEEESVNPLKKDGIVGKVMERGAIGVAQGVYGLGRAAQGAISQNLQVLEDIGGEIDKIPVGRAATALVPGLRGAIELAESDVGESVKQYSQEVADIAGAQINEWQRKGEAVGGGLPGKVSQLVGSAAVSVAPAVVTAPFGGIPAAAIAAGMQSFGSTSADATDAYRNQGLSDDEARNKALIPSVASGLATAAITALGGKSGPEALAGLAKSSGFRRFAIDLLKGAGVEAGEETVDQLMQSAIQKLSFNPELTLDQALEESAIAGGLGFGLGGGFKVITQVSSPEEVKKEEFKAKIQETVAQVENLAAAGLPQTAAVLAEQDKQKLVLEAVEEATTQPEFLTGLSDEELIRRKEEASPEQARAIDEEINRRTQGETDAIPIQESDENVPSDASQREGGELELPGMVEEDQSEVVAQESPQEQVTPTDAGLFTAEEVSSGDDLLELIQTSEPETEAAPTTEQVDEVTTGEDQPAPPSGAEIQPAGARAQNSPKVQNQLAEALQPLKARLIKRASDLGVSDAEAVANDAILRSIKTAKNADEAGRIANSTGIQQAVADTLRKEGAEMRRAQSGAVSLEEEVSEGQTLGETIAEDISTPEQEVAQTEQRQIFNDFQDEFFSTLTPAEKAIWRQIHNTGTGRAPKADKINEIAAKFSRFLKSKGMRDIRAVPAVRKAPKNWRPTSDKVRQGLVKKYKLDKGITEALKALGTNSENTYRALIAKFLAARVRSDLALVPKQYLGFRPYDGLFGYNGQLPAVLLNMSNLSNDTALEQIFLHETIHAMTTDLVDIYQESPNLLTPEQRKLIDGVNNLFEEARKQLIGDPTEIAETLKQAETDPGFYDVPANRAIYGLTDLGEFISEAMSNPEFQQLLKSVQVKTPRKTAWKELVHLIKRLLGVQSDSVALDRAIEDILSLVDEGKRFAQSQENVARGERQFKRSEIGKSKVTTQQENANVKTDEEVGAAPVVHKDSEASAREAREISLHLRGGGSTIDPATLSEPARRAQFYAQQANLLRWARDNGKLIQSPGIPTENLFAQGAEHQVYLNPDDPSTIIKRSIPGQFGASHPYIDELGTLQRTPAVPSDYFDRLETDNTILGDDRKFLGIEFYPDSTFSILTSQPQVTAESHKREGYTQYREKGNYIQGLNLDGKWELVSDEVLQNSYRDAKEEGNDALARAILNQAGNVVEQASQEDIDQNFINEGFKRLGTYTWLDPTGEMIIDDTHPRNFILMENGQIRPVDVNVRIPSEREVGTLRRRFGRELPGPAMAPASLTEHPEVQTLPTPSGLMQYGPVKAVIDWTKENFRARGKFNEPTFNAMLQRNQSASSIMNKVENNIRELRRVLKPEDSLTANAALKGDKAAFQALPENVQPIINDIRQDVDRMSRQLIDSGVLSEELTATVDKNLGVYLNRSYEIFDNPKFKEKAKNDPAWAKTMHDARAYLKKYILADYATGYAKENSGIQDTSDESAEWAAFQQTPEFTTLLQQGAEKGISEGISSENEIEKELNRLLDVGEEAKGSGQLGIGRPGRKNLNILKKRKDIPVEIRNLWGEYNDPMVNYVRTMSKMASLVTNHKFLTDVAAQGLSEGWLFRDEDPNRPPETVPVVGKDEANKAMQPLAGLYGDETIRTAFREFNEVSNNAPWVRVLLGLTGLSMAAKTVGSVQSTVRNFLGNILFAMANGQLSPSNIGNLWEAGRAVEANLIARTGDRKAWQEYFQKLIKLGVVSESASGNTLRDLINRASKGNESQSLAENMADGMISKSKRLIGLAPKLYQSVDDFWKVYAYETEKARYQKAFPDMPEAELDQKVAQIVRNTYPTYSLAPQAIQKLRRFPFIAPFVTFTSESVRVLANTLALTKQELADPATRSIGTQRAIGTASAALLFPTLGLLMKSLLGLDDDDEKAVRELMPEWQKNAEIILLGKDNKGKISYLDVSYLNPYNYVKEPFTAFKRGESLGESMKNSLRAIFEPVLSEQILAGTLADIARNKTESGREIYNPQGSADEQAKAIAAHLWNAFEPGTVTSMERITKAAKGYIEPSGRGYKLGNEVAAVTTGQRISEIDATQGIQGAARRFKRENLNAVNIFTGVYKNRGTIELDDIKEKYQEADDARYQIFKNLRRAYDASIILGMKPDAVLQAMKAEELGSSSIGQIKEGIYHQYHASPEAIGEAVSVDKNRQKAYEEALKSVPTTRTLLD